MELLALLWIGGLILYFKFTTQRQRENYLLVAWAVLLSPIAFYAVNALLR